jgi:hypothetical protein
MLLVEPRQEIEHAMQFSQERSLSRLRRRRAVCVFFQLGPIWAAHEAPLSPHTRKGTPAMGMTFAADAAKKKGTRRA